MIKYHKISFEIAYWSRFRIFKENQENPEEIAMVGQSVYSI